MRNTLKNHGWRTIFFAAFSLMALTPALAATTYYVSPTGSDSSTGLTTLTPLKLIQTALTKTVTGDSIILEDGIYTGTGDVDLAITNKTLTIASQNGASKTVINCNGNVNTSHRGFLFTGSGSSTVTSKLQGVTIENGVINGSASTSVGGAISCANSSLTLTSCSFVKNNAYLGGACANDASSTITFSLCSFSSNSSGSAGGVASDNEGGKNIFVGCQFIGNSGNVIFNNKGTNSTTNCSFTNNNGEFSLGIIEESGADQIYGCHFTTNTGTPCIYANTTITIDSSVFTGNTSGAISAYGGNSGLVRNCIFSKNSAPKGGAINNAGGYSLYLEYCSFNANTASSFASGGAIYNADATLNLIDDILWGDSAPGSTGQEIDNEFGTTTVSYSDLQTGFAGTGNLKADPLFAGAASGNLHVTATSPCIKAGTPISGLTKDLDGNARPTKPTMGAYEGGSVWSPLSVRVSPNGNTILLFGSLTNEAMLITVPASGTQTTKTYGPVAGTMAADLALGSDNSQYIVWQDQADDGIVIWHVPVTGTTTVFNLKPTTTGWTEQSTTVTSDGHMHILWKSLTGEGMLWNVDATGKLVSSTTYGPF
jgi:hypothetical protein